MCTYVCYTCIGMSVATCLEWQLLNAITMTTTNATKRIRTAMPTDTPTDTPTAMAKLLLPSLGVSVDSNTVEGSVGVSNTKTT